AVFDRDVLAFVKPSRCQALTEARDHGRGHRKRRAAQEPDHWHGRPLRTRPERPRSRTAEQRDEIAAPHSMTSSAATSRPGGTVRPSAFAVLMLRAVTNLVAACTGRSAGLAPRRMRST